MKAGKLDRRLTVKARTTAADDLNELVETWATLTTVWAARKDVSDAERLAAQQIGAEITARFTVRWSDTLEAINPRDHRLVCDGREYDLTGIKETARRETLELTATARADQSNLYT